MKEQSTEPILSPSCERLERSTAPLLDVRLRLAPSPTCLTKHFSEVLFSSPRSSPFPHEHPCFMTDAELPAGVGTTMLRDRPLTKVSYLVTDVGGGGVRSFSFLKNYHRTQHFYHKHVAEPWLPGISRPPAGPSSQSPLSQDPSYYSHGPSACTSWACRSLPLALSDWPLHAFWMNSPSSSSWEAGTEHLQIPPRAQMPIPRSPKEGKA